MKMIVVGSRKKGCFRITSRDSVCLKILGVLSGEHRQKVFHEGPVNGESFCLGSDGVSMDFHIELSLACSKARKLLESCRKNRGLVIRHSGPTFIDLAPIQKRV